jgi:hypothetical protein
METCNIVRANGGWAISHNEGRAKGSYPTKEGAFEVVYLAASNDIKKGAGIIITVEPPVQGKSAIGADA